MRIGHTTPLNYAIAYSYLIFRFLVWYLQKHPLKNVGDIWQVDEKQISVAGFTFWLLCVIDVTTEFVLVMKVFRSRTAANLANALYEAQRLVRKSPLVVETDALRQYRKCIRRVFGLACHWRAKKTEWYGINNLVENLNSILEAWIKVHKGFHSLWTAQFIVDGIWIHHNFVKKTTSQYPLHTTTAETAGFDIELTKPWTQLISLAEKAALLGRIPRGIEPAKLAVQTELDEWTDPQMEQAALSGQPLAQSPKL
jgi:transposase-like protein